MHGPGTGTKGEGVAEANRDTRWKEAKGKNWDNCHSIINKIYLKNTTEMQKKIYAAYGEGAVTDGTCQKWFAKFPGTIDILAT